MYLSQNVSIDLILNENKEATDQYGRSILAGKPVLGTECRDVANSVWVQIILEQLRLQTPCISHCICCLYFLTGLTLIILNKPSCYEVRELT